MLRRPATAVRQQVAQLGGRACPSATSSSGPGRAAREAADRERRPVDRQRRDHDVDPRAVGEPGVDHRAELVDPAAERRQDPLDRVAQLLLGGERDLGRLDPPARARRRPRVGPLTITSSTAGSASSSSSGPRPTVSRRISSRCRSRRGSESTAASSSTSSRTAPSRSSPPAPPAAASARRRSTSRAAQVGGERLGVAIGRSHATVNPAAGRGAPVRSPKPGRNECRRRSRRPLTRLTLAP